MKKIVMLLVALCLGTVASAQVSGGPFDTKSPLRYHVLRYTFSTTANIVGATVGTLPPGGAVLRDVVITQIGAGVGGTSWTATPKRATLALSSTDGGFTLAAGALKTTNTAASPMGSLTNPTGGTRPVVKGHVAATGTVTITAGITAAQTVTIGGVTFTAVASGATGDQFNIGASETEAAANLAAAINASRTASARTYPVAGDVVATSAAGVVNVTAKVAGAAGNALTLAASGANVSVSAGTLTGGFDPLSTGGEFVTMDITLSGAYSGAVSGEVVLFFEPKF